MTEVPIADRLRAVVVPPTPLLFEELTGPAATDATEVRRAVVHAVSDLVACGRPHLVLVGTGTATREHPPGSWGTLAGLGAAIEAPEEAAALRAVPPSLPLALTVGCRLLDVAGAARASGPPTLVEVAADATPDACWRLGVELTRRRPDAVWLLLGDGTTKRTLRAPGAFDERAEPFDALVAKALASGRPKELLALDAVEATALGASGRAAWQVLAGAWEALHPDTPATATVDFADAPFGVGYVVARWSDPRPGR